MTHSNDAQTMHTCQGVGILRNAESCQGVICGKSSAERFANYPLLLFRIPQTKNVRISTDCKTTVRSHCTTDVQPMHTIPWSLET